MSPLTVDYSSTFSAVCSGIPVFPKGALRSLGVWGTVPSLYRATQLIPSVLCVAKVSTFELPRPPQPFPHDETWSWSVVGHEGEIRPVVLGLITWRLVDNHMASRRLSPGKWRHLVVTLQIVVKEKSRMSNKTVYYRTPFVRTSRLWWRGCCQLCAALVSFSLQLKYSTLWF